MTQHNLRAYIATDNQFEKNKDTHTMTIKQKTNQMANGSGDYYDLPLTFVSVGSKTVTPCSNIWWHVVTCTSLCGLLYVYVWGKGISSPTTWLNNEQSTLTSLWWITCLAAPLLLMTHRGFMSIDSCYLWRLLMVSVLLPDSDGPPPPIWDYLMSNISCPIAKITLPQVSIR